MNHVHFTIRPLVPSDSMDDLTQLLHRAFGVLARAGFNYTASYQGADETLKRCQTGECYLAEHAGTIIGMIVFRPQHIEMHDGCAYYERPDVGHFAQFAVDPDFQKCGVGSRLLEFVERRATELKTPELAFDTAEGATDLIAWYARRGYQLVDITQWEGKTYRSIIMSKRFK